MDSWNHLSLVQLITRILVCLSGKVAQEFALMLETSFAVGDATLATFILPFHYSPTFIFHWWFDFKR